MFALFQKILARLKGGARAWADFSFRATGGAAFCLFLFLQNATAQKVRPGCIDGEIYLRLKTGHAIQSVDEGRVENLSQLAGFQQLAVEFKVTSTRQSFYFSRNEKLLRTLRIKFADADRVDFFIKKLMEKNWAEYAEPVRLRQLSITPNDVGEFAAGGTGQWSLYRTNAFQAWDITTGNPGIVVAVVDNAIQTDHEDLAGNMVAGRDVSDNDNDPNPPMDTYDHGTHCAGIVAAEANNGIGVASIGYNLSIMPIKARGDGLPPGFVDSGYEGIAWAATNGADIITNSWGGPGFSATEQDVIDDAVALGSLIVAAAGNDNDNVPHYPAAYNGVIAVANTRINDVRSGDSCFGPWVDIAAPGSSIRSTVPTDGYAFMGGTSMAAPFVAGLCGLIMSTNPALTLAQVEACLESTATNIDAENPMFIGQLGAGRVDAFNAVRCALCSPNATINDTYTGPKLERSDWIRCNAIIPEDQPARPVEVVLDAANFILLRPGFHAERGSIFRTQLDGCGGAIVSNDPSEKTGDRSEKPAETIFFDKKQAISVFPNPTAGAASIQFFVENEVTASVQIFDSFGKQQTVLLDNETLPAGQTTIQIPTENWPNGFYTVHFLSGKTVASTRLVVLKN